MSSASRLNELIQQWALSFRESSGPQKLYKIVKLLFLLLLLYQVYLFIAVGFYSLFNPSSSAIMRSQARFLQAQEPPQDIRYSWVDYEQMSGSIKRAVIASEDSRFVEHSGVEWQAIWEAYQYNRSQEAKGKAKRRGGSTISQQLAKNLFLSHDRSYWRKGQELIITYMLETLMSKQRILELYLNVAQFGPHIFGIEAASQHYYKQPAARLNAQQAARLAALLPNPSRYSQQLHGRYINSRTQTIVQRMRLVTPP